MSLSNTLKIHNYPLYPYKYLFLFDLPGEIWKPVPDYENYLEVSNYGRVKCLPRELILNLNSSHSYEKPERILTQQLQINDNVNTLKIALSVNKHRRVFRVKNLVYSAFVEKVNFKDYDVILLDNNGENCMLDNLALRLRRKKDRKMQAKKEKIERIGWTDNSKPYQNLSIEDMEGEIWKPMLNYETRYMVSNLGRIKSISKVMENTMIRKRYVKPEKIRKQVLNKNKRYLCFSIYTNNIYKGFYTAYVVYSTFITPINSRVHKIIYRNKDSLNCRLENLDIIERKKKVKKTDKR